LANHCREIFVQGIEDIFVQGIEDEGVSPLPNAPSHNSGHRGAFIGAAAASPHVLEACGGGREVLREEEGPNFLGPGALDEQVVSVFIPSAGEVGGRSRKPVPEATFVGGESVAPS
jgi:hypothetical protein